MHCKCNLTTIEITKYKARLNIHGGKQRYGINYFKTYAPVVTWFAIRLLIIIAILFKWAFKQVDFFMADTQAQIEIDMYMELPVGIEAKHGNNKWHVLRRICMAKNKLVEFEISFWQRNCLLLVLSNQKMMSVCSIKGW